MSVPAALKNAIREIRLFYGDADLYWNTVIDMLAEWQAVATPEPKDEAA